MSQDQDTKSKTVLRELALANDWNRVREEVRVTWGLFSEAELDASLQDWDRLLGIIRQRTGESVEVVEAKLDHIVDPPTNGDPGVGSTG